MSRAKPASTDVVDGAEESEAPRDPHRYPPATATAAMHTAMTASSTIARRPRGREASTVRSSVAVTGQPNVGCPNVLGLFLNGGSEHTAPYSGVVFGLYLSTSMKSFT